MDSGIAEQLLVHVENAGMPCLGISNRIVVFISEGCMFVGPRSGLQVDNREL